MSPPTKPKPKIAGAVSLASFLIFVVLLCGVSRSGISIMTAFSGLRRFFGTIKRNMNALAVPALVKVTPTYCDTAILVNQLESLAHDAMSPATSVNSSTKRLSQVNYRNLKGVIVVPQGGMQCAVM